MLDTANKWLSSHVGRRLCEAERDGAFSRFATQSKHSPPMSATADCRQRRCWRLHERRRLMLAASARQEAMSWAGTPYADGAAGFELSAARLLKPRADNYRKPPTPAVTEAHFGRRLKPKSMLSRLVADDGTLYGRWAMMAKDKRDETPSGDARRQQSAA